MAKCTRLQNSSKQRKAPVDLQATQAALGARTGRLKCIDHEGRVFVDFHGNPHGPLVAKHALSDTEIAAVIQDTKEKEIDVLLVFDNNDIFRPIIIGKVQDRVPTTGVEIYIRGRSFSVDTDEDIELRCGEAKLRITRDGKLLVLGNDIVSRSRGCYRIKGGTVKIN